MSARAWFGGASLVTVAALGTGPLRAQTAEDGAAPRAFLETTCIECHSPVSNSNAHDHYPLPVVVFGHGAGRYRGNEHIVAAPRTPMANLFMSIAAKEGIELDEFGDSTGTLEI